MTANAAAAHDCPSAASIHHDLYVRTLHRACVIKGGIAALASELQLRPTTVEQMLMGKIAVPLSVFFAAVDILLRPLT